MNIIDFVKRLFKRKSTNINDLIKISDSFVMPTRGVFKGNKEILNLIDTYKDEYKKVLSNKKYLLSMDLTNSINDNIRMYSELITNIFTEDENLMEYTSDNKIKMFYKVNKLNLYNQEIERLNLECTARLIALMEIFNERKMFISKHKKEAILFAMNILTNALVVFEAQRTAIEVEKENFLKKYASFVSENEGEVYEEKRKEFIHDKIKVLNRVLPLIGKKLKGNDLSEILFLERELEIYVYNNRNKVESLKKEIDEYYYDIIGNENALDKLDQFKEIDDLERKALVFFYYGKNLISIDEIYKLYELKLIYLIYRYDYLPTESRLEIEREGYTRAVFNRVENILKGKNPAIKKMFGSDSSNAIKYIINELKSDGLFDVESILTSSRARFLFSFDYEDGFIKYLNSIAINRKHFEGFINFYDLIFSWDEYIPITFVFEMIRLNERTAHFCGEVNRYSLYKLYQKHLNYYKLPEGIRQIYISVLDNYDADPLVKKLNNKVKGKKLVLPNSLESFRGSLFPQNSVKELVLNDGIKVIGMSALACAPINILTIPASLEGIVNDGVFSVSYSKMGLSDGKKTKRVAEKKERLRLNGVETLIFKDYKNSQVLNNKDTLRKILEGTIIIKDYEPFELAVNHDSHRKLLGEFLDDNEATTFGINKPNKTNKPKLLRTSLKSIKLLDEDGELFLDIDISNLEAIEGPLRKIKQSDIDLMVTLIENKISCAIEGYDSLKICYK